MSMQYVRNYYSVPAKKGGRVQWNNRLGTITSATAYIYVRFDDAKHSVPLHPKEDGLVYLPPDSAQAPIVRAGGCTVAIGGMLDQSTAQSAQSFRLFYGMENRKDARK